jgi:hypothetical protein
MTVYHPIFYYSHHKFSALGNPAMEGLEGKMLIIFCMI